MRFVGAKFWTALAPVSRVAFLVDSGAPLVALVVGMESMGDRVDGVVVSSVAKWVCGATYVVYDRHFLFRIGT